MRRKRYCQLISLKIKLFRVDWCLLWLSDRDTFKDVFVDESNIDLRSAGRLSFYQMGSSLERISSRAAKPKHSYTVRTCYFRPTHNVLKFKASIQHFWFIKYGDVNLSLRSFNPRFGRSLYCLSKLTRDI